MRSSLRDRAVAQASQDRPVDKAAPSGAQAHQGAAVHEGQEVVGEARHRAGDADAADVGAAADTVHPAARRDVALGDRPRAADLRQAAPVVCERRCETAVLGEPGAVARLVRGLLEQPERTALIVELGRRGDARELEGDALEGLRDRVRLDRAAGEVDQRRPAARDEPVPEVVAQSHRARRVVAHRRHPAVRRARAERHHDGSARGQPVDPRAGSDRLALAVDSEAAPVPLAVDLLVRDRPLHDEHERIELASRGCMPRT